MASTLIYFNTQFFIAETASVSTVTFVVVDVVSH